MEGAGTTAADVFSSMPHTATVWRHGGVRAEAACRVLLRIVSNVIESPSELRFRRVRESGSSFATKVMGCAGAIEVLETCGFERVDYPDGVYFVIKSVDVERLQAVRRELELGLRSFDRLREVRSTQEAFAAAEHDQHANTAYAYERQLSARAIVHRVNAAQERCQRQRAAAGRTKCVSLAVVLVAVAVGTLHVTSVSETLSTWARDS